MTMHQVGTGDMAFLHALLKRGFVNIPRVLFDYTADMGLDYDTIGRIFAILACVGGPSETAFEPYTISRRTHARDFDQVRLLIADLEQKDIVRMEEENDAVSFSFVPLYSRLRATWEQYREKFEDERRESGPHPAIAVAQRVLGRTLSDRDVADILDWVTTYKFDVDLVAAVCREGVSQNVVRMNYLNQIARHWFEEGIRSPDEAEAYSKRYRKSIAKFKSIIQYIGLKRQLMASELALLEKWSTEWGFSNEVIIRACTEATGSNNPLQYINRVLESWHEQGVKTVADADQAKRRPAQTAAEKATRERRGSNKSNVFLKGEKKDDSYYDHIYKKYGN